MPIAATDIVVYASASMPDADTGANGGAIDPLRRIAFTQPAANDTVQVVSTAAGDTQTITVEGRNAAGGIVTETKALTGVTPITLSVLGTIERVLKAELASNAIGIVTVKRTTGGAVIGTIPVGERGFMGLFRKAASDPSVTKNYYTKVFVKNIHGSLSLLSALIKQNADPDARVNHLLATAINDSATAADRVTAPSAANTQDPDTFDDTDKAVPGTDLAAGAAIGVWMRLQLPAGDAAHKSTYTLEVAGQST
jgi:hypothetical protein